MRHGCVNRLRIQPVAVQRPHPRAALRQIAHSNGCRSKVGCLRAVAAEMPEGDAPVRHVVAIALRISPVLRFQPGRPCRCKLRLDFACDIFLWRTALAHDEIDRIESGEAVQTDRVPLRRERGNGIPVKSPANEKRSVRIVPPEYRQQRTVSVKRAIEG